MNTLVIHSSVLGERSTSKALAEHLTQRIRQTAPTESIVVRDLAAQPLPYLDSEVLGALFTPAEARTPEQARIVALSDSLIAELQAADRVVIAVPVYNFSVPAQLKSYIDYVARAGITFRYTKEGVPEGLLKGKRVYVLLARGGKAAGTSDDNVTPYVRQMLGFLGMTDIEFVAAEGMAMGEAVAQDGLSRAKQHIEALAL